MTGWLRVAGASLLAVAACVGAPPAQAQDAVPNPAAALLDIVLTTEGRVHGALRDALLDLGDEGADQLTDRSKTGSSATERWLADMWLARVGKAREVRELQAHWAELMRELLGGYGVRHAALVGRTRPVFDDLPNSTLWPSMLADWAAFGWDGRAIYVQRRKDERDVFDPMRLHAMLVLADHGDIHVAPFLAGVVENEGIRDTQRVIAASALARLLPDGCGDVLKSAPIASYNHEGTEPAFVPSMLRRCANETRLRGSERWYAGSVLTQIQRAHPEAFREQFVRSVDLVEEWRGGGKALSHSTGAQRGENWIAVPGTHSSAHMIYGPYTNDLAEGHYLARFRVRCSGFAKTQDRRQLELDITHNTGRNRVANRSVGGWSLAEDTWMDFYVGFPSPGGNAKTEFRVFWDGHSTAEVESITIYTVKDAQDSPIISWEPPDVLDRPIDDRRALADHLLTVAHEAVGADYVGARAGLDRLPIATASLLFSLDGEDPRIRTGEILAARAKDPDEWTRHEQMFVAAMEEASTTIEAWRTVIGSRLEWQIAVEARRSITVEGERADPGVRTAPAGARAFGDAQVMADWEKRCRLTASPPWRDVLLEIGVHHTVGLDTTAEVSNALAVHALVHAARLGDRGAHPRLVEIVEDGDAEPGQRAFALATLVLVGDPEYPTLFRKHARRNAEVREPCSRWLSEYGLDEPN